MARKGWGHSRFEIHAFVGDYRIDMTWPKRGDMEKYPLSAVILKLEKCIAKLKMVEQETPDAK